MREIRKYLPAWKILIVCAVLLSLPMLPSCGGGGSSGKKVPRADTKPPAILFTQPADGETNVSPYAAIELAFNEKIDPKSIGQASLEVEDSAGAVAGRVRLANGKKSLIFEPDAPLAYGETVRVKAAATIKDLAGNKIGAGVAIGFDIAGLPHPEQISGNTSAHHYNQAAVFADNGDGLLVWETEHGNSSNRLYCVRYDHTVPGWSEEEELISLSLGARDPAVASKGDDIVLVWRTGNHQIFSRRLCRGVWDDPVELSSYGWDPCIAESGDGFLALWSESYDLRACVYSPDTGWGAPLWVSQGSTMPYDISVAALGVCNCAVYNRAGGVYALRYNAFTGEWTDEQHLGTSNSVHAPQVAAMGASPTTGFVAAWYDGSQGHIASSFSDYDLGGWHGLAPLSMWDFDFSEPVLADGGGYTYLGWCENTASLGGVFTAVLLPVSLQWSVQGIYAGSDSVDSPSVAATGGDFAVAWRQADGLGHDIRACVNNSAKIKLDFGIGAALNPHVVSCGDTFFASWNHKQPDGMDRLFGARYVEYNGGWDYENHDGLSKGDHRGESQSPVAAVDDTGRLLALWQQYDSGKWQIHGNFCESGIWGTPFLLADRGEKPQVASNGEGFLAAWGVSPQDPDWREQIAMRLYSGGSWSEIEIANTDQSDIYGQHPIGLASDGDGYLLSFFQYVIQNSTRKRGVVSRYYDPAQSQWGDLELHEWSESRPREIRTVSDGAGFSVVWNQHEGSGYSGLLNLKARVFDGTVWDATATIESIDDDFHFFDLASDGQGYAVIAEGIAIRHDGAAWLPEEEMTPSSVRESYLASNGSGYAALWPSMDYPGYEELRVKMFDGSQWGFDIVLESEQGRVEYPSITSNGTGYAVIWPQGAAGGRDLWACTFGRTAWRGAFCLAGGSCAVSEVCAVSSDLGYSAIWTEDITAGVGVHCVKGAVSF